MPINLEDENESIKSHKNFFLPKNFTTINDLVALPNVILRNGMLPNGKIAEGCCGMPYTRKVLYAKTSMQTILCVNLNRNHKEDHTLDHTLDDIKTSSNTNKKIL